MTGDDLPNADHAVRYVKPSQFDGDEGVDGSAFQLRQNESGLSVHWLECFEDLLKPQQLDEVRRLSRLTISRNGRLAEVNVGRTKQHLKEQLLDIRFIHMPLNAEGDYEADPSHSEISGLPDFPDEELIGDLIAEECIEAVHPGLQET
jgi:hypothetical protein